MSVIFSNGRRVDVGAKSYPFPTSMAQTIGPTAGLVPLLRADGQAITYEGIYRTQPMVHAVVSKLVYGIARLPWKTYEYGLDGDTRRRLRNHPLNSVLQTPHPRGSAFSLKAGIALSLHLHGNALVAKSRPQVGAEPNELWLVPWRNVQVIYDERGPIGYQIQYDGVNTVSVGPEEVIHFQLPAGVSPLEPLRRTLALEDAAMTWQGENLRNGATPRGAFTTDQRLPDAVIPRLRAELERLYAGPENAGRFAVLDNAMKFSPISQSAVDTDLISQRKLSREEVCAAYDVPPALLGLEVATYSSVEQYRKALYDAIATKLNLIEETLQAQFISQESAWDGTFVEFDTGELLRPDVEARMRAHMLGMQASITTINERRRMENLPPMEDPAADIVMAPANMAALGSTPASGGGTPMQGIGDNIAPTTASALFGETSVNIESQEALK